MISVQEAEQIILQQARQYGSEILPLVQSVGRVLAVDIVADRDLPPYHRVTMDGIAICYDEFATGRRAFTIAGTVAAGDTPPAVPTGGCVEIMTGAALPTGADTIIRYEDTSIANGIATVTIDEIKQGANLHRQGVDKQAGSVVVAKGSMVTAAVVSMAASVGYSRVEVLKLPRVVVVSTGDELVDIEATPAPFQVRRSNSYAIQAVLAQHAIVADLLHIPDEPAAISEHLSRCFNDYDVLLLSGGVSMGKFDHLPTVLEQLGVQKLFHKVKQRPGKPFWFGAKDNGTVVFAFPGNPVSAFMCVHRYFIPWLQTSLDLPGSHAYAVLDADIHFKPDLALFQQVRLYQNADGRTCAKPVDGNGSGDFSSLIDANAFLELPAGQEVYKAGEAYKAWRF